MELSVGCRDWSLKLPLNWQVRNDGECLTMTGEPDLGALQLSVREKEGLVEDFDLRAFACDRVDPESKLHPVAVGSLLGFCASSEVDGILWREWWLRGGCMMFYATYNVDSECSGAEDVAVEAILTSLSICPRTTHYEFDRTTPPPLGHNRTATGGHPGI